MIISYKYNFIFIKTQKTAGTSIELCLSKYLGSDDVITPVSPPDELIRKNIGAKGPQNHNDISYLPVAKKIWRTIKKNRNVFSSHMSLEQLCKLRINISDFEIVTVSRNPWEVNASLYYYEKNKRPERVDDDFNKWVMSNCIENFDKLKIGNKYIADKILFYNNLHEDYAEWVGKMGLPSEASGLLKKVYAKSGVRPQGMDYFSIYSDAAKELVESKNRYEINQFGHKFNN